MLWITVGVFAGLVAGALAGVIASRLVEPGQRGRVPITVCVVVVVVFGAVQAFANWRSQAAPPGPTLLASDSPVKVRYLGSGDTIEISWAAIDDPVLNNYSVDVSGLAPTEAGYNVGYRDGEELRTSATTNPVALTNEKLADEGVLERVDGDETWRVCVTGMRETPGGVDVAPYVIEGTKRCSDPFTIP